jgi:hypothetical protein
MHRSRASVFVCLNFIIGGSPEGAVIYVTYN